MYQSIKSILMEFFLSDFWQHNLKSIITTFGTSLIGTGVKAMGQIDPNINNNPSAMTLVDIFQVGSYAISMMVGITVIIRFIVFALDKKKLSNLRMRKRKNGI